MPSSKAWLHPWIEVMGVLRSWETFATKSRWACRVAATCADMLLKLSATRTTSSGPSSGSCCSYSPWAIASAAPAMRSSGRATERVISQANKTETSRPAVPARTKAAPKPSSRSKVSGRGSGIAYTTTQSPKPLLEIALV